MYVKKLIKNIKTITVIILSLKANSSSRRIISIKCRCVCAKPKNLSQFSVLLICRNPDIFGEILFLILIYLFIGSFNEK